MIRSLLLLGVLLAVILAAPALAPHDPMTTDTNAVLQPPSGQHPLGTDRLGRDLFSRLLYGGQRTVGVAALATVVAVLPGLIYGAIGGVWRGRMAGVLEAFTHALLAIPGLVLALVVVTLMGPGLVTIAVATGLALAPSYARVTRAAVAGTRDLPFIDAARAVGVPPGRLLARHLLPNVVPTLAAYAGVVFAYSVLNSAALSFLGLSGDIGVPDWGTMLFEGRLTFRTAPWVSIAPGLAITGLVVAVNAIADRMARLR